jgi:hypothetical protein
MEPHQGLMRDIYSIVEMPKTLPENFPQGKVTARFAVDTNGDIINIKIIKSPLQNLSN